MRGWRRLPRPFRPRMRRRSRSARSWTSRLRGCACARPAVACLGGRGSVCDARARRSRRRGRSPAPPRLRHGTRTTTWRSGWRRTRSCRRSQSRTRSQARARAAGGGRRQRVTRTRALPMFCSAGHGWESERHDGCAGVREDVREELEARRGDEGGHGGGGASRRPPPSLSARSAHCLVSCCCCCCGCLLPSTAARVRDVLCAGSRGRCCAGARGEGDV